MPEALRSCRHCRLAAALLSLAVFGCASTTPTQQPPEPVVIVVPASAPAAPATIDVPPAPAADTAASGALAYADKVRTLPAADLAQEIGRLSQPGQPVLAQVQLAVALLQARGAGDVQRATQVLQRVLGLETPEARPLHPLARLLLAQAGEQRRGDEQTERQAQQLREAQRRIDQLNERLDALRAIERARPRSGTP